MSRKIAQLHGAMETIDIYAITAQAAESGADLEQLAAQIRVERHVTAIEELGIPRFRITNGPVGVGMGDGTPTPPATSLPMTIGLAAGFDPDLVVDEYRPVAGAEVVRAYLGIPVDGQPPKRLVGFQKVFVEPGESKPVAITIDPSSTNHPFGVWDYCTQGFVTKPGEYLVYVGNSAETTPHTVTFSIR